MLKTFDLRKGEGKNLSRVKMMKTPESILCGELVEEEKLAMVGCTDGNIFAFDLD
jgi:hypothetical protein